MSNDKARELWGMAQEIAGARPDFHAVLGPGLGDRATGAFMQELRKRALAIFGTDYSERKVCGATSLAVDFYIPDEGTIVEVALGLPNPASEFEKDVLKAVMAQECGSKVSRLFFISRPGGEKKCAQPCRTAVRDWAQARHGLLIEVHDLDGEVRKRRRRARSTIGRV